MKNKKLFLCIIAILTIIISISTKCLAATDEFQSFISTDLSNDLSSAETISIATIVFQNLGYINVSGENRYATTAYKSPILNYISGTGKNYGLYVSAHGNVNWFTTKNGDATQRIYNTDISGYWHLVFLDCCLSGVNDNFANAFKTTGYSNRAFLGWFDSVTNYASREWWGYFYQYVGKTDLRTACLSAADKCTYSTPIRMYGDKTWN